MKSKNPYIFFTDIETTGFSPIKNDMIVLAGIIAKKVGNHYERVATFDDSCRPYSRENWTSGAEGAHGFTLHEAMKFQHPRKMLIKFLHFLVPYKDDQNDPLLFVDHSRSKFDYKFILNAFIKEELEYSFKKVFNVDHYESTVSLANKYKTVTGLENAKLPTLAKYFNIKLDHHNATSDANCCFESYKELKKLKLGLGLFHDE